MANDLELQQEAELKLKAKAIVENFIKSYGENPADYNEVFYQMNERVYSEFKIDGLHYPFPQMDVHLRSQN